jgi:hypothetical protein
MKRTAHNRKPATLWHGQIPEIFGYGIEVVATSKAGVMTALRNAYAEWKVARPDPSTDFKTSFARFGGYIQRVEIGKAYHDGFRS